MRSNEKQYTLQRPSGFSGFSLQNFSLKKFRIFSGKNPPALSSLNPQNVSLKKFPKKLALETFLIFSQKKALHNFQLQPSKIFPNKLSHIFSKKSCTEKLSYIFSKKPL